MSSNDDFSLPPYVTPYLTLDMYAPGNTNVVNRADVNVPYVADSHMHYKAFGSTSVPFLTQSQWQERAGVLFTTVFGLGQRLPIDTPCGYYNDPGIAGKVGCGHGEPVRPSIINDIMNGLDYFRAKYHTGTDLIPNMVHVLSMTFPDVTPLTSNPSPDSLDDIEKTYLVDLMKVFDHEFKDFFKAVGEINLCKQALGTGFGDNSVACVPWTTAADIISAAPYAHVKDMMTYLEGKKYPIAVHSDLGINDPTGTMTPSTTPLPTSPTDSTPKTYQIQTKWLEGLSRLEAFLTAFPNNKVRWCHMGLSKELSDMTADVHIAVLTYLFNTYPNFICDLSWSVLVDQFFFDVNTDQANTKLFIVLFNTFPQRFLAGTDFVGSDFTGHVVTETIYRDTLVKTGSFLQSGLNDEAYRGIILGQNFIDHYTLPYLAPQVKGT